MATDIILNTNEILLKGLKVSVQKNIVIGTGQKLTRLTDSQIFTDTISVKNRLAAKKLNAASADIGILNVASVVGDRSTPGKITIGKGVSGTLITDKEIKCKKFSAPFFEGLRANLVKLDVRNVTVSNEITAKKITVSGTIKASGIITAKRFTTVSDARCKQDINSLSDSLDKITCLQGVSFNWKEDELPGSKQPTQKQIGFLAQDVEKILPESISKDENGQLSVDYISVIPLLVEGMKTQQENIQLQREQIESKSQENKNLLKRVFEIEKKLSTLTNH